MVIYAWLSVRYSYNHTTTISHFIEHRNVDFAVSEHTAFRHLNSG